MLRKCCQQLFAHFVSFQTFSATLLTLKFIFCHMHCLEYRCSRSIIHVSVVDCSPSISSQCVEGIIGSKHINVFLPLVKVTIQFLRCIDVIHALHIVNSALQTNKQC